MCIHILMLCYSMSKVNKVVPCNVSENTCLLSISMSMLYVSDMHTYLQFDLGAVLQHVKSEEVRPVECFGEPCVCINTYVNSMLYRQVPLLRHIAICKVTSFCQCICVNYTWVICAHILMLCYSMSIVKVVPCTDILTLVYRTVPYQ